MVRSCAVNEPHHPGLWSYAAKQCPDGLKSLELRVGWNRRNRKIWHASHTEAIVLLTSDGSAPCVWVTLALLCFTSFFLMIHHDSRCSWDVLLWFQHFFCTSRNMWASLSFHARLSMLVPARWFWPLTYFQQNPCGALVRSAISCKLGKLFSDFSGMTLNSMWYCHHIPKTWQVFNGTRLKLLPHQWLFKANISMKTGVFDCLASSWTKTLDITWPSSSLLPGFQICFRRAKASLHIAVEFLR